MKITDCRHEVQAFAVLMEKALRKNDWKGGWQESNISWLLQRAHEELAELVAAVDLTNRQDNTGRRSVAAEAADVANFCMMVSDNAGELEN